MLFFNFFAVLAQSLAGGWHPATGEVQGPGEGSIFEVFQEGLGSIFKVFQKGLVHNVNSMFKHVGHASGWAGGVTRSVKN